MSPIATSNGTPSGIVPPVDGVSLKSDDPSVSQLFSLKGRTAIVTGGARGLGITLASALVESGAHVYCLDILPEASPKEWAELVALAEEHGVTVNYRHVDITSPDLVKAVFEGIASEAPAPVRVLIAAAGIQHECPAIEYSADLVKRMMDVNVVGTFNTIQAAAIEMLKHGLGGSIIMIASMSGSIANRGLQCTAYNTSKAGLIQMCRSVSAEWAGQGIRVNTISPGYIMTAMTAKLLETQPELEKRWADDNPLQRVSQPWEYKGPAVFLASDASSFCTGMDLRVDGGHCAW
ncbi:NAD-P-binding protein [Cylindrobasidium torrendii FP15055 ss-10]|uniref:NAD-P-binding protein n=1 Tax=Cylindrobasidium torrendii FP15055 ss-10 TaxID=1314674 RepID=A0A0D7B0R5_9AGAR|nr:NAD-P-binding protein [Cylindrobasidium torrendii FP15055 ss-10]